MLLETGVFFGFFLDFLRSETLSSLITAAADSAGAFEDFFDSCELLPAFELLDAGFSAKRSFFLAFTDFLDGFDFPFSTTAFFFSARYCSNGVEVCNFSITSSLDAVCE